MEVVTEVAKLRSAKSRRFRALSSVGSTLWISHSLFYRRVVFGLDVRGVIAVQLDSALGDVDKWNAERLTIGRSAQVLGCKQHQLSPVNDTMGIDNDTEDTD